MADVWTFDAGTNTFTLTMDGSGSGQKSRSQTFPGLTADALYTVYLTVNPSDAAVEAFLEIDGGTRDIATVAGSQTLGASGDADGSGNLTVRFGVQESGGAAASASSDTLQYADEAAAVTGGWTVSDTMSIGTILFDTGHAIAGSGLSSSIAYVLNGLGNSGNLTLTKTYNVGAGTVVRGKMWAEGIGSRWEFLTFRIANTAGSTKSASNKGNEGVEHMDTGTLTAGGDGLITVSIFMGAVFPSNHNNATWYFAGLDLEGAAAAATLTATNLTYCSGSGVGDGGTGLGGDGETPGDDPIPDPPPDGYPPPVIGGARPFVTWDIPVGGAFYWNGSLQHFGAGNTVNLINTAGSNDCKVIFVAGSRPDYLDGSGRFSFALWKAAFDEVLDNAHARDALEQGITDGVVIAHYLIDEPYVNSTRYGGSIPVATVERMAQYSKSLGAPFTTWGTVVGCAPYEHRWWLSRALSGVDYYGHDYTMNLGDVNTWLSQNRARAVEFGAVFIPGVHYLGFDRPRDLPGDTERVITPDELRHYGGILARMSDTPYMAGWKYNAREIAQPGFLDALKYVRDLYASYDP